MRENYCREEDCSAGKEVGEGLCGAVRTGGRHSGKEFPSVAAVEMQLCTKWRHQSAVFVVGRRDMQTGKKNVFPLITTLSSVAMSLRKDYEYLSHV